MTDIVARRVPLDVKCGYCVRLQTSSYKTDFVIQHPKGRSHGRWSQD